MTGIDSEEWDGVIRSWSLDWARDLPIRTQEEEATLLRDVRLASLELQEATRGDQRPGRALHAHGILATDRATLRIRGEVPQALRLGPFIPGASWPALVRFSNGLPTHSIRRGPRSARARRADHRGLPSARPSHHYW